MASQPKTKKTTETALAVPITEAYASLIAYEAHPKIPGEIDKRKPYVNIEFETFAEGMEDLDMDEIPVTIQKVKLLQAQSDPVDAGQAKAGQFWHENNVAILPENIEVVALYTHKVKYPPSDISPEGSEVSYVVFTSLEYIQQYQTWMKRALDPNDFDLGQEIMSNIFEYGFQSTGMQQYNKLLTNAQNQGGFSAYGYKLWSKKFENNKGKWYSAQFTPNYRLNEQELIAARSLKNTVRTVANNMEAYYAKRREAMGVAPELEDAKPQSDVSEI